MAPSVRAVLPPQHQNLLCNTCCAVACCEMCCAVLWCVQVLYGATDLLSGQEFLQQLEELGRRSGITSSSMAAAAAGGSGGATL